jgi:hypothetical protein
MTTCTGADPGFQVRVGAHLKKLRRAEGGAKMFGVFRFYAKKSYFFPILGGGGASPPGSAPDVSRRS